VSRENFYPKPKVDSVVLKFTRLDNLDKDFLKEFNRFVINLFSYRRKTIQNSLLELISKNSIIKDSSIKEKVKEILDELNIDQMQRVETLNIETLKLLFKTLARDRLL
jgi:16S rRNA (adenine1518-N6/adenine1519-N6)-dimethyltransferase